MVQNPIAMAWDKHGRMWVAENYTYGSRKIRFDLSPARPGNCSVRYGWRRAGGYPEGIY
jgi:hypothetical protein